MSFKHIFSFVACIFFASFSIAQTYTVTATALGANEVPANASTGTADVTGTYDGATGMITISVNYSGLGTDLTASHLHLGAAGTNGGVIIDLMPSPLAQSGTFGGTFAVTAANEQDLIDGNVYINLHTSGIGSGELRDQLALAIVDTNTTQSYTVEATGSGANEVPANASAGTAAVTGTYDAATNMITITVNYSGLGSNLAAAHLHAGMAGMNGPVIVDLMPTTGATSGTISGTFAIPVANEQDLIDGNVYINLHTTGIGSGELRDQLTLTIVAPVASAIPTMGEWGLISLGLLFVIFGIVGIRQKQNVLKKA